MKELVHMAKVTLRSRVMVGTMLLMVWFSSLVIVAGLGVLLNRKRRSLTSPSGNESVVKGRSSRQGRMAEKPPFGPINSMRVS